ncbi:MAG: EAL domain-containing protein [Acidobacteria bacterium]|nr:EAL domain-containing protein [Acidobacteriota bacterium]
MTLASTKAFIIRHRRSIADLTLVAATVIVGLYLAMSFDFFLQAGHETIQQETIELDEALLIGGVLAIGLLIFAFRRYREQKRESARRLAAEQHIRVLAFQDPLTGLPNRRQFDDALKAAIAAPPREGAVHAVLLLDLNGFKQINDVHGHGTGDEVLTITAQRLLSAMRDGDLVARLGGDEFAVLATHLADPEAATNIARRIIDALKDPIHIGSTKHMVGSGIGIALMPSDATAPEEILRKADLALYRAKEERRSAMHFFEDDLDARMRERDWLEQELRAAVTSGQIQTFFEPAVDLRTREITGFEASPRWLHPTAGEIGADRFIAIAEESGLIHELMDHILRQACVAAANWPSSVILSIDILPVQLKDKSLQLRVLDILSTTGFPAQRLEMEITESALVRDLEAAQIVLGGLRDAGVRIALDNFGTGYSSLYHLRNFKLDKIKIDSSFIRGMRSEQESADIVRALVGLAHGLGLTIAADGIEDHEQQSSLLLTGCEQGQGHLYSKSLSAEQTFVACTAMA